MKIIIENGGTKLDWGVLGEKNIHSVNSINLFHEESDISKKIKSIFPTNLIIKKNIEIDFYTAGLTHSTNLKIKKVLLNIFNMPTVNVFSDILAASRALFNNDKGIVCIMGTGSNCAFFDGKKNHFNSIALGHLLGDEGSGYDLGKSFLISYYRNLLPENLKNEFKKEINIDDQQLLTTIYSVKNKKFYIASFAKFLKKHEQNPYIQDIVRKSFINYFNKHPFLIKKHQMFKFGFVGSIAFYFQNYIDEILAVKNIDYQIIDKPIRKLLNL